MVRSILAVVAGFLLIGTLSLGTSMVLMSLLPEVADASGRVESVHFLLLTQLYVAVYAVGGCYLAARLAPARPMLHALVLGGLGLAVNVLGVATQWDTAPAWYHVLALLLVMPYAWTGGRLRERELERNGEAGRPGAVAPA